MDDKRKNEVKEFLDKSKLFLNTGMTFKDIYELSIVKNKRNLAFQYIDDNNVFHSFTYNKINKITVKYAKKLSILLKGKNKEHPIILKLHNSPYWCVFLYAILMNGFTPLLINARSKKESVVNLINKTNAVAIITDDPFSYPILKINPDFINDVADDKDYVENWGKDIIFCSSGTTGDIKLVVYNDKKIVYQIMSDLDIYKDSFDIMYPKKHGDLKILAMIPFHHIFGFVAIFLWYTFYGKTIVFPPNNNIKQIQNLCVKRGITHIYSVPLFWDSIANAFIRKLDTMENNIVLRIKENMSNYLEGKEISNKVLDLIVKKQLLGNKIRFCISGGGYLSKETCKIINSLGYPLHNGYGMTEIGITSVELSDDIKERLKCSIGKPFKDVSYVIKNNQLLVKSPAIHNEDFINNKREPTKLDENGFFETGDMVSVDKDGKYYIKGRIKDVIINADGENVFPDELELYFKNIKNVENYTILGIKDKNNNNKENICFVAKVKRACKIKNLENIKNEILTIKDLPNNSHIDEVYFTSKDLPISNSFKIKRIEIKNAIESNSKDYYLINEKLKTKETKIENIDNDIINEVKEIYSNVLTINKEKINIDSHWLKDLGGDSMLFIELIEQIEKAFDIVISPENYNRCVSIKTTALFIQETIKQ